MSMENSHSGQTLNKQSRLQAPTSQPQTVHLQAITWCLLESMTMAKSFSATDVHT